MMMLCDVGEEMEIRHARCAPFRRVHTPADQEGQQGRAREFVGRAGRVGRVSTTAPLWLSSLCVRICSPYESIPLGICDGGYVIHVQFVLLVFAVCWTWLFFPFLVSRWSGYDLFRSSFLFWFGWPRFSTLPLIVR